MMQRGEVWVASFRPWRGKEVGKVRPCVIMQADWLTSQNFDTVLALPLTSKLLPGADSLRVEIAPRERLKKTSWVMSEKLRALDRSRFGPGPLARLTEEELAAIEQQLRAVLGML
ncbi:type II toxin-antitoxin system PemK/MazF family toxin [Wenzhouxiangella sp. AB-CW3]|uniref:type II toxin-antitoxin system PemK/MazF family toxin n=1 Tax=Wenzhouxiangella sp. AB-CW3 TaxID=2771012 RepID=UPI00168AC0A2|nr:type II toxin-antitoxin system PemK/MazF family toxin [Wenzhouxiangella sp. AB-CW3]QOC21489.1 type II toxin-antitoxin system PemK/MazF family toxin [Wenzhouxiangella sp. AB-CW3]